MLKLTTTVFCFCLLVIISLKCLSAPEVKTKISTKTYLKGRQNGNDKGSNNPKKSDSAWRFTVGQKRYAGSIDSAVFNKDKNAFYFWGPSYETPMEKVSLVAFFPSSKFNGNLDNISTKQISFVYGKLSDAANALFSSNPENRELMVTIKYNHTTGIVQGDISGKIKDDKGKLTDIKSGKFEVHL